MIKSSSLHSPTNSYSSFPCAFSSTIVLNRVIPKTGKGRKIRCFHELGKKSAEHLFLFQTCLSALSRAGGVLTDVHMVSTFSPLEDGAAPGVIEPSPGTSSNQPPGRSSRVQRCSAHFKMILLNKQARSRLRMTLLPSTLLTKRAP